MPDLAAADTLNSRTPSQGQSKDDLDYQALYKELYGDTSKDTTTRSTVVPEAKPRKRKPGEKMGPAPGLFTNSYINGLHIAMNAASPYLVAGQLSSWYSYIDYGVTLKLPTEIDLEDFPLYMLFEVSNFSFENSYPEGGTFQGLAYIFQVSAIGDRSGAAMGIGFWDTQLGGMMEVNYRFRPTRNTFLRFGTRGVLMSNVEPLGAVWWLESRISMGLEL
ncbi:MAG: hypothetical protein K9M49_08110 [Candidatus Marinimicrobia bacterium]|nr:hypothetical protein [Candidatus Neomarinimicrobiota bacterium]MCF7850649.1 hypothetical protein [Candidatus Neomarinimicrobiota bacterium]MCF7905102.1 hypothetical protein [Candidatus Neomarinimicrobiota bacterium]